MSVNPSVLDFDEKNQEIFCFRYLFYARRDFRNKALELNLETLTKKMGQPVTGENLKILTSSSAWIIIISSIYENCYAILEAYELEKDDESLTWALNKAVQIFELATLAHAFMQGSTFDKNMLQLYLMIGCFKALEYLYDENEKIFLKKELLGDVYDLPLFNITLSVVESIIEKIEILPQNEFDLKPFGGSWLVTAAQILPIHFDKLKFSEEEKSLAYKLLGGFVLENGTLAYVPYLASGKACYNTRKLLGQIENINIQDYFELSKLTMPEIDRRFDLPFQEVIQFYQSNKSDFYIPKQTSSQQAEQCRNSNRNNVIIFFKPVHEILEIHHLQLIGQENPKEEATTFGHQV